MALSPQDRVLYVERLAQFDPGAVGEYLRCVYACLYMRMHVRAIIPFEFKY